MSIEFFGRSSGEEPLGGDIRYTGSTFEWVRGSAPSVIFPVGEASLGSYDLVPRAQAQTYVGFARLGFLASPSPDYVRPLYCQVQIVDVLPEVQALSLTFEPPLSIGQRSTVRLRARNAGAALASVPWSITYSSSSTMGGFGPRPPVRILAQGVARNVDAGALFEAAAEFTPGRGAPYFTFDGSLDPRNSIGENEATRGDNHLSHRWVSRLDTHLVTQDLNYRAVQRNGARFEDHIDENGACPQIGVGNWEDASWAPWQGQRSPGVLFAANCPIGPGEAHPEAYLDFRLKHGWRVKSVEPPVIRSVRGSATDFELTTTPAVGSETPYMRARVRSAGAASIWAGVRVVIEGPEGTDPYRDGPCDAVCDVVGDRCFERSSPRDGPSFYCQTNDDCALGWACGGGVCRRVCGREP